MTEDQPLGLEDAQRLAQRRPGHPEALDQVGLVPERVTLVELAGDDQPAELVGDLLRLLPRKLERAERWSPARVCFGMKRRQHIPRDRARTEQLPCSLRAHAARSGDA